MNYSTGVNDVLTRKKIAMLMHNTKLKWRDVEDDETFFCQTLSDPKLIDCTTLSEVLNKNKVKKEIEKKTLRRQCKNKVSEQF